MSVSFDTNEVVSRKDVWPYILKVWLEVSLEEQAHIRNTLSSCADTTQKLVKNRPLTAVIHTLLSSADRNVRSPAVIAPLPHFLPNQQCARVKVGVRPDYLG